MGGQAGAPAGLLVSPRELEHVPLSGAAQGRRHGEEPQWGAATQMWGQAEGLEATCRVARVGSNSRKGPWVFTLHPGPTSQCHPRPQKCS